MPLHRSRSDAFDDLVVESAIRLQRRWTGQHPAAGDQPARITVYRRPVETRAASERSRAMLVHDVVVEQVATLLGLEPETVDPDYGLE